MLITYNHNKTSRNTMHHSFQSKRPHIHLPHQFPLKHQPFQSHSVSLNNADTNSSSHIFHEDMPLNSSFLSECENDFDFLADDEPTQPITHRFHSFKSFITYYSMLKNKRETIESILLDKNQIMPLFESESGIEIIIFILKEHHSLYYMNIIMYYISLVIEQHNKTNFKKLLEFLFHNGNTFIRNQILSVQYM